MARTLKDMLAVLEPVRRECVEEKADRRQIKYLTIQELRRNGDLSQAQLGKTHGICQAMLAKYEPQTNLRLSMVTSCARATFGSLKRVAGYPGKALFAIDVVGETEELRLRVTTRRLATTVSCNESF